MKPVWRVPMLGAACTRTPFLLVGTVASILLTGCGSRSNAPSEKAVTTVAPTPTATLLSNVPHNYVEREDDTYSYISAVSEEDQKKGSAVGTVVRFRYRGVKDGLHILESVSDRSRFRDTYECPTDCKIIKLRYGDSVDRIPYNPGSVIGSAFEDAINGQLEASQRKGGNAATPVGRATEAATLPAAYVGEWNADLAACGTDNNDSRLRIQKSRMFFYESEGDVTKVSVKSPSSVTVTLALTGEGQTWNDTRTLTLSNSNNDLTIADFTRHRCS